MLLEIHRCNLQQADLRQRECCEFWAQRYCWLALFVWHQDHCQFAVYPCETPGTGAGSLLWKHRDRSASPGCGRHIHRLGVCFQEGSADLVPLEDEWNERRRIQMTSVGFKGKNKSVCVIFLFLCWRVSNVTEWQMKNHWTFQSGLQKEIMAWRFV